MRMNQINKARRQILATGFAFQAFSKYQ